MANTTDKTVTSKYQPKSTNVIWVDTSQNPPVEKHFINGRWQQMSGGGGTKKYSDLEEKPLINGVELDGNKTSSELGIATSQQGAKADTAYQKPQSGIPYTDLESEVQTSLDKADSAVQQVTVGTTTTGAAGTNASVTNSGTSTAPVLDFTIPRGADGADAVNPFKGWFNSLAELKAAHTSIEGNSAYVKDASPDTTWSIYVYDSTASSDNNWADSGTDADTSNVQTFASGEEVNEVHIIDDLTTGGSDDVLSAEQGKEIGNCLLNNYFIGKGTTYTSVKIKGLASGRKYRLVKEIIQHIDVTPGDQLVVFGIYAYHSDSSYDTLANVLTPQGLLRYYDFIVPNNTQYIEVGGRANSGVKVRFIVYDITEINDILSTQSLMQQEISLLRTGSVKNCISNTKLDQTDGKTISAEDVVTSDYIPYTSGNSVEWKYSSSSSGSIVYRICFYNSSKEYINGAYWSGGQPSGVRIISSSNINTYAPNAAFIRANFADGYSDGYIKIGETIVYQPIFETVDGIETLRHDIDAISSDSVMSFNAFKKSAINSIAMKIGSTTSNKPKHKYFTIIHQSDIHGDATRFKRMVDFGNTLDNIDAIIETGDFQQSEWGNTGFDNTYVAFYQTSNVPILPVIGNHDVGNHHKIYTNPANTNSAVGAKYVTPYMEVIGGVQGGTDAGYYYRDFSAYNIRVIVLNEYETPRVQNSGGTELKYSIWSRYLSQKQANWLVTTLNSVQSDWSVIICMHQLIDVFPKYDNEFKCSVDYTNGDLINYQGTIIQDIVDAYISRGTISKSYHYTNADTSEVPDVTVNGDFTTANGEFICYINGHTHNDGLGQSIIATNKQVNLNVTTGNSSMASQAIYDDLYRGNVGISQDAFNLISFDTSRKQIRVLRIGANVSADMRRRDYACVSYSQS